jgi:hypothetical protein
MHTPAADSSNEHDKNSNIRRIVLDATAGAVAGCVSRIVVGPLDVIKIRFQVQLEPIGGSLTSKYKGLGNAFRTIVKEEGVKVTLQADLSLQIYQVLCRSVQRSPICGPGSASQCSSPFTAGTLERHSSRLAADRTLYSSAVCSPTAVQSSSKVTWASRYGLHYMSQQNNLYRKSLPALFDSIFWCIAMCLCAFALSEVSHICFMDMLRICTGHLQPGVLLSMGLNITTARHGLMCQLPWYKMAFSQTRQCSLH